tara:strand:+ start:55876 stop:58260 length:2385 start_codon:yes stop_codon:yes gene_type:complete
MFAATALMVSVTTLPGYALCRILDASADRYRKMALTPALGLLLLYGCSGALVLVNLWSWFSLSLVVAVLNGLALVQIRNRTSEKKSLTPWQKLERAMHGEVYGTPEESISEEAATQQWLQQQRTPWLLFAAGLIPLSCLTLPMLQELPFGVDWIGFSMLTGQIASLGTLALPGTNSGFWTYPPALPSVAAWIQLTLNVSPARAVFVLGHYSLFALVLGIGGAMDRHGSGPHGILAMGLGIGLFAKVFDSGYPTVASQLGLVVGLLVLLRPTSSRGKHHTRGFMVAFLCVAMIHPTGAIYLGMLMLAHIVVGLRLQEQYGENIKKILYASAILLTCAGAVALLVLAPRMLESAVFAEYGWQGGRPLLTYNGILLVAGLLAAFYLRATVEGHLLAVWLAGLWILTGIHLVEGLERVPVLSLLSYTLYSMGLHAFHIPLAALVALWWSDSTSLTPIDEPRGLRTVGWDPHIHTYVSTAFLVVIILGVAAGNAILLQVSTHDELRPIAQSDVALKDHIAGLPDGSVIYSENAHWGYVFDPPNNVELTSIPTLGLVQLEASIQAQATSAVFSDNAELLAALGITHAISSPIGTVGWYLAQSVHWDAIAREDGSALWQFDAAGTSPSMSYLKINQTSNVGTCTNQGTEVDCKQRIDPWSEHRFRDPLNLGSNRAFIPEGTNYDALMHVDRPTESSAAGREICVIFEAVGDLSGLSFGFDAGINQTLMTESIEFSSGWHRSCMTGDALSTTGSFTIQWTDENVQPTRWVNPLGFSGRGDALLDYTGIRLHWLEMPHFGVNE